MVVNITRNGSRVVAAITGRLIATTDDGCWTELVRVTMGGRVSVVIVDLAGLERIDCAGLGRLVQLCGALRDVGATLQLVNVERRIMRILELTGLAVPLGARPGPRPLSRAWTPAPRSHEATASLRRGTEQAASRI